MVCDDVPTPVADREGKTFELQLRRRYADAGCAAGVGTSSGKNKLIIEAVPPMVYDDVPTPVALLLFPMDREGKNI